MYKSIALGTIFITNHLTRKDVTKSRKCIIQCFIINGFVQIFNEYVAYSTFAKGWITLRPHDAYWLSLDHIKIHGVQSTLRVRRLLEVHIRVAQGTAGDHVPADPDGEDGPGRAELLVEHRLGHVGVQVPT